MPIRLDVYCTGVKEADSLGIEDAIDFSDQNSAQLKVNRHPSLFAASRLRPGLALSLLRLRSAPDDRSPMPRKLIPPVAIRLPAVDFQRNVQRPSSAWLPAPVCGSGCCSRSASVPLPQQGAPVLLSSPFSIHSSSLPSLSLRLTSGLAVLGRAWHSLPAKTQCYFGARSPNQ